MSSPRRGISARAEKAIRLTSAGVIAAPFGLTGYFTDTPALGYVALGVVLVAILLGPVIEHLRGTRH